MDSSSPTIFKQRTKSKSTQRARQTENEDGATAQEPAEESPSTLASKLKNKVKRSKKSRLSFGGDDEEESNGEVFQVKKSNLSRKLALGTHPASIALNLEKVSISQSGPSYDAAYLKELKASTPSSRPPPPPSSDSYDADMSMNIDVDDVSGMGMDTAESFTEAIIPTELSIKTTKERRKQLRKTGASGEEDFISLSVVRKADEPTGPHPESRLMREEDELGEGDDASPSEFAEYTSAQDRIALGKKSRKAEAAKRRDAMKEMIEDAADEDEETVEWEQEQLRRGGHIVSGSRDSTPRAKDMLLKAIVTTFQVAIADTEVLLAKFRAVQRGIPAFDPQAIPARRRFLCRRVKLLQNLLRWRKHTGERFGVGALTTQLIEQCVMEVAETGWEVGGEDISRKVVTMLPQELIPGRMKIRFGLA
ncbi:hypothetical protein H0H93_002514 [Arthromyces matolae]|nr:hypothetical protein H0H93_002514 [Arthromyces matolae]